MREIKFKRVFFFDEGKTKFSHFETWGVCLLDRISFKSPSSNNFAQYFEDCQFTGLHDKNGKEIYEQDILRIKGIMGDSAQYKFDALYRVNSLGYEGLSLSFVKLFNVKPDSAENSYPICQSPSFKYGSLNTDYRNNNDDRLVIPDTTGRNDLHRHSWKEHHYTNDIEIIDNPELLNA